ncbi:hypothetical protein TREES_T100009271 [Tupaia chinensis]|uniref:Cilia- and flagella-associated protein 54 n=1 Tax=Tupaia chinensis TaxID=246437 RepID=L9KF80_TUPCH|nr:hypothetical protein TREES_T100009271 [Tupaia chinensis]
MAAHGALSSSLSDVSPLSVTPSELPPTPPPTSTAVSKSPLDSKPSSPSLLHPSTCPEDLLPLAVFYGPVDARNPLLASCEKEIRELLGFMKKKKALATTEKQKHEFRRRCAISLFDIWTKYAPRLPADYYNEKLLKVGDSLCQMKEYKLALLQCYGRYLQQFSTDFDENKADVNQFKTVFFPKGFGDKTAGLTFHALSGRNMCNYQLVCDSDVNLKNKESVTQCLHILSSLRLIMQALDYLLWASICMESSVPLLSIRYLTWRATLYTAVCQCYYDCQAGIHGEAFARRALAKIDELRQLELMSSSRSQEESRRYYREATIKLPWPRTITERLLEEMFDNTASQFLAVLEALSDSNRRILQTGPVVTDEVEIRDVVSELFIAGKDLLIISNTGANGMLNFPKTSLLELIVERKNVISMDAAVKFVKLAFTYEEWSLFESSAGHLIYFLQDALPDKEIVVDMIMFLWQKCKLGIQRFHTSRNDYAKFTQKISTNKWVYLLWQINEVILCYKMEDIDIVVVSEVTIRLSEILESLGNPKRKFRTSQDIILRKGTDEFFGTPKGISEILPILKVLAHRGGYWTLLQNCCRAFWNFTQEVQILIQQAVDLYKTFPISQDAFLCTSVLPFSLGAELLIDMLIQLQNTNSIKSLEDKGEFSVPSCYGNIKNDNGGFSLTFEHPLDDVNVVDLKWIHDFVLKSLEVLYQVEKWETLVSLAIQFNIISHERYTEQVTPLLVYGQRQLLLRIQKFEGPDITQQPCANYEAKYGEKITCRNFIGKQLMIDSPNDKFTAAESCTDFLKMLVNSEYNRAKELVCVPVDVTDTLRCFRETLEKSKYHNRSIRHSRKLLLLFLAQTQGDKGGISHSKSTSGKVEFCLETEEMHMPTPPDLSQEHFRVFGSVEKSRLSHSQLGLVISSYYQTIDVLQASNQRSLKVQALHSLGNLLVFADKKRAAYKCWCQALDDIFRTPNVLHTWKELGTSITHATSSSSPSGFKDYSEEFLSKVGIWGCLQGAVISAKIAQFIKTLKVTKRTSCCILSALLFQGLLRTTLPHPKAERCYAQYEITQLLPGIELFSDRFRADLGSVVASLYYVIRELHFAKQNLIVLPLLALYQYFVSVICQDLVRNLEARILKIEILIDLGFFSEAFNEIAHIFYGKNMPSSVSAGCKATGKNKILQSFDTGKPLNSKENVQALDELISKGLPLILGTVGHQHLINKFYFIKAHFFLSVAATINCVPENTMKSFYHGDVTEKNKPNLSNVKDQNPKEERGSIFQLAKIKDDISLGMLKAILLTEAEDRLNFLVSEIENTGHKNLSQCSAGELETVVEARLQLAAIALQRHRAAYSAAIIFSTLKLLQDSKLFKKKIVHDDKENPPSSPETSASENRADNEFLDPISLNSREYFNIHLWLRCRLVLVTAFVAQIRGIGIMKENDMTDCVSLINEVCMEAKAAEDIELQAEFLMQAVILGLQEKHLKADIITKLQDIIHLLERNEFLSPRSWLTLARSLVLLDDLTKAEKFKDSPSSKAEKVNLLAQAHNILIEQMLTFGETIEYPLSNTEYANPLQPLKNIYLPHVMLLAKIKMRIGHTMAKQVYNNSRRKSSFKWLPALHLFEMALKLCKISAKEEHEVEAEILFQKGKIERQIIMEDKSPTLQFESLLDAIQLSLKNDQNSGFSFMTMLADTYVSTLDILANIYHSQVSDAVLAVNLLIGKKNARTDKVNQMALPNIPEFATVDLLSSYTDYLLDNYQVVFQTCYTCLYQNDDMCDNTDSGNKTLAKVDITWILLLRYYIHLQRINNMSKLLVMSRQFHTLRFISKAPCQPVLHRDDVIRYGNASFKQGTVLSMSSSPLNCDQNDLSEAIAIVVP